jgi:beta-xylosidase
MLRTSARSRLRCRALLGVGAAAAALAGGLLTAGSAAAAPLSQTALMTTAGSPLTGADPGVMHVTGGADAGWYVYSTGGNSINVAKAGTVTGPYSSPAVTLVPQAWFETASPGPRDPSHDLWAPSVFAAGGHYVMYFAAYDSGHKQRCVGVAEAAHPLGPFTVVPGTSPICAPKAANYQGKTAEAIDPSFYRAPSGQRYLLFKAGTADRHNVAIWSYKMQANGEKRESGTPRVVLRAKGPGLGNAIENPELIGHGGMLYLFVSANYYGNCSYRTDVYSASSITAFTNSQTPVHLLTHASTGKCGPGGASVTTNGATIVYHAWQDNQPSTNIRDDYTAKLTWTASGPSVS